MFINVDVFLTPGTDTREFVDSFSSNDLVLFHAPENAPLATLIRKDFLETVAEDSRVEKIKVTDSGAEEHDIIYPDIKYQQGTQAVTGYVTYSDMPLTRPLYGSSDSEATQKASLIANKQKNYLGNHFMGKQMTTNLPHRYNDPTGQSTRPTVGRSYDDTYQSTGPFGHTLNPLTEKTDTQYESRFFGKNVDIIVLEPTQQFNALAEDFYMPEHPEWQKAPDNDPNILGNDGLGDAPTGAYNYIGSRLNLKDWNTHYENISGDLVSEVIPSSGGDLGGQGSVLSRYTNTNLSKSQRAPIDSHMSMCLSLAGGLAGGYAKKANLYPMYNQHRAGFGPTIDDIIDFHQNKPINSETGVQNPTIVSCSWGASGNPDNLYYAPVFAVRELNHLGTKIERPSGGWGSDLTPFVNMHIIPTRMKHPTTGVWEWFIPFPAGAFSDTSIEVRDALYIEEYKAGIPFDDRTPKPEYAGVSQAYAPEFARAWEAGITICQSGGNTPTPIARSDEPEYNDSFLLDVGSDFFELVIANKKVKGYTAITTIPEDEFFALRSYTKSHARDGVIVVAAGYMSDSFPGLDEYSVRGPGVDIIGDGFGVYMGISHGYNEFPADTPFGIGAPLETTNAMYSSSVPYPFSSSSSGASDQTFQNPSLGIESGWIENPLQTNYDEWANDDGQFLYEISRTFTSDGVGQDSSWSTPSIVAKTGYDPDDPNAPFPNEPDKGQNFFVLYRKNNNTITATEADRAYYNFPYRGMDGWSTQIPELSNEGDIIYRTQKVYEGYSPSEDNFTYTDWEQPVVIARRTGGRDTKLITLYKANDPVVGFEGGDKVRITSLGSNPSAWPNYLGTTNTPIAEWNGDERYTLTSLGNGTDAENQAALNAYYKIAPNITVPDDLSGVQVGVGDFRFGYEHKRFKIVNLGTHSDAAHIQTRWNEYFGTENVTYSVGHVFTTTDNSVRLRAGDIGCVVEGVHQVGDVITHKSSRIKDKTILDNLAGVTGAPFVEVGDQITLPASINTNAPPGATVTRTGHSWSLGSGTSAACPSVAGRLACMAEEYFHTYKRWPTNKELKGLMLDSAKRVDIQNRLVDWSNTPPAFHAEVSTSPYQVFFSNKERTSRNEINKIKFWENAHRGATWNFSRREGKIGPSGIGWKPENTPSTTFTINLSSVASSSSISVRRAEYSLTKDEKYGLKPDNVKMFESTLVSVNDTGFKDSNNQPVTFTEGDILTVTATNPNDYISRAVYTVVEYNHQSTGNPATLKVQQKMYRLNKVNSDGVPLVWSTIPSIISGLTFTVSYVKTIEKNNIEHYLKLENESGQSEGAGAYCYLDLEPGAEYRISVDSDKPVRIQLDKMSTSPQEGSFTLSNELNFSNILAAGTITPEEARTSVMIAGTQNLTSEGEIIIVTGESVQYFDDSNNYFGLEYTAAGVGFGGQVYHKVKSFAVINGSRISVGGKTEFPSTDFFGVANALDNKGMQKITSNGTIYEVQTGVVGSQSNPSLNNLGNSGTFKLPMKVTTPPHQSDPTTYVANTRLWDQMSRVNFDFDKNGAADALTDGLLFLRYLFGLRGENLREAVSLDSPLSIAEIEEQLSLAIAEYGDIDGNGETDALTDGLLLLRYLFNLTGDALINSTVATNATRTTADQIIDYIETLLPQQNLSATFGYRSGTNSAIPSNYPTEDVGSVGQLITAEIDKVTDEEIFFKSSHGIPQQGSFMVVANGHPTLKAVNRRVFTTGPYTTDKKLSTSPYFIPGRSAESNRASPEFRFGEFNTEPYNMVQIYRIAEDVTTHTVKLNDPSLSVFTTPVASEMFDNKYFRDPNPFRDAILKYNKPWKPYKDTAWKWTQLSGQFLSGDLGSISEDSTNNNTFTDGGGNTRTIRDMWWTDGQEAWEEKAFSNSVPFQHYQTPNGIFCFSLQGTNIPNTNETFGRITINNIDFERSEAYYNFDSNGNTVWWWHLQNQPQNQSVVRKLGKVLTSWIITNTLKNEVHFTNPHTADDNYYKLCLKNPGSGTGLTTLINSVHVLRKMLPEGKKTRQPHTVHPPNEPSLLRFIPGFNSSDTISTQMGRIDFSSFEASGTPPLRAHYVPGKIERGEVKPIGALSFNDSPNLVTSGATFPSQVNALSSTNDMTDLEAGIDLTKYGWQKREPEPFTIRNVGQNNDSFTNDTPPIDPIDGGDSQYYSIAVSASSLLSDPSVPSNGTFTLGPVVAEISPPVDFYANYTVLFQWQKSTNGTTWTDISRTDTTYTNAQTNTLTVTNYSGQAPVGDYYRCKLYTLGISAGVEFTNAVYAKSG